MSLTLPGRHPRHRAVDRAAALDTECRRLKAVITGADEVFDRLRTRAREAEIVTRCTLARIDERHAETVEQMQREIDELRRRLDVAVLAEAAVTQTQPWPTITQRFEGGSPVRLGVALDDTVRIPVHDPAHIPAWATAETQPAA